MKKIALPIIILAILYQCSVSQGNSANTKPKEVTNKLQGFVFIEISKIYQHQGKVTVFSKDKDTILYIENKNIHIKKSVYEIVEEEYLYKKSINIELLNPEYGLFILKCFGTSGDFYKVEINGQIGLIINDKDYVEFKDFNKYIMDTYPIPTEFNPIRIEPNENSKLIQDFDKWTFLPIEIKGDWLKVIDNKKCYKGVAPSPNDIKGWIRWKKNGEFILKVAHTC
jgi:hypothetical protein